MDRTQKLVQTLLTVSVITNFILAIGLLVTMKAVNQLANRPVVVQLVPAEPAPPPPPIPQAKVAPAPDAGIGSPPAILAPAAAPPIKSAVPLPPVRPVADTPAPRKKVAKKKVNRKHAKIHAKAKPTWHCRDLPYYARDLSAATIRSGAKMQGYSDADVNKALRCLGKMGAYHAAPPVRSLVADHSVHHDGSPAANDLRAGHLPGKLVLDHRDHRDRAFLLC